MNVCIGSYAHNAGLSVLKKHLSFLHSRLGCYSKDFIQTLFSEISFIHMMRNN